MKKSIFYFFEKNKKRIKRFLLGLALVVFLCTRSVGGLCVYEGIACIFAMHGQNLANGTMVIGLLQTEDASKEYLKKAYPLALLEEFYSQGGDVHIVFEDDDFYDEMIDNAQFEVQSRQIYMRNIFECRINPVVLHEFGHYVDQYCTNGSSDPKFIEIASNEIDRFSTAEKYTFTERYELSAYRESKSFIEYYASAYGYYCWNPLFLKIAAPNTYRYLDDQLKNYK